MRARRQCERSGGPNAKSRPVLPVRLQTADEYRRRLWKQQRQQQQQQPWRRGQPPQRQRTTSGNRSYSKFHGYAYDAVWTIALAVDAVLRRRNGRYDAGDFRGDGRRLHAALNRTDFLGVTVRPPTSLAGQWRI